jgi:hypothetical protein
MRPKEIFAMHSRFPRNARELVVAGPALGLLLALTPAGEVYAATSANTDQMISIDPLTKYTLPDQTASVMLPDGWHVTRTGIAFIRAEGSHGELGFFGLVVPAHDGPAAAGPTPGAPLSQPYSTDTASKIQQSINWVRASNGQSLVQVNVVSQQPFNAPAEFGQCSRVLMTLGVQNMGTLNSEADFCSLPTDPAGNYRNFMKIVAAPPDVAAAQRGTLETVLASYVLNMKAVQTQLAQRGGTTQPAQDSQSGSQSSSASQAAASQGSGSQSAGATNGSTPAAQKSAPATQSRSAQAMPATRNSTAPGRGGNSYANLQQKINAEIAQGGFSPQMVAAMRAQANAQAAAVMGPALHQVASFDQGINYYDRSVLRGQIPVSVTHAGTFWIDPN